MNDALDRGIDPYSGSRRPRLNNGPILSRMRAVVSRGCEGNALVEFAIVAPLLVVLLTGMFSAAMAIYSYERLGEATFAGSQILQDGRGMLSGGDPCLSAAQVVSANLPSFSGTFSYTVTFWTSSSTSPRLVPSPAREQPALRAPPATTT
jgi:Flp pilus assembly protein TadG